MLIGSFIALLPFYFRFSIYDHGDISATTAQSCMFAFLIVLMALLPSKKRDVPLPLAAALGIFVLMGFWNQYEPLSIGVFIQSSWVILAAAFAYRLYESIDLETVHYVSNGMAIGCLVQSSWCIAEQFGFQSQSYWQLFGDWKPNATYFDQMYKSRGTEGGSNHVGSYIAINATALFRRRWAPFLAVAILGLLSTQAVMSIAALGAGILYLGWDFFKLRRVIPYGFAMIGMVTGLYSGLVGRFDNGRIAAWKEMVPHFLNAKTAALVEHGKVTRGDLPIPLWSKITFGMGPGWFFDTFPSAYKVNGVSFHQEHSEFLACFFAFGAIGCLLALGIFCLCDRSSAPVRWRAALFVAFISFFGHFTLHQPSVSMSILVAATVCLVQKPEESL